MYSGLGSGKRPALDAHQPWGFLLQATWVFGSVPARSSTYGPVPTGDTGANVPIWLAVACDCHCFGSTIGMFHSWFWSTWYGGVPLKAIVTTLLFTVTDRIVVQRPCHGTAAKRPRSMFHLTCDESKAVPSFHLTPGRTEILNTFAPGQSPRVASHGMYVFLSGS